MAIKVFCEGCNKTYNVRDDMAGKRVKCPGCGGEVVIPKHRPVAPTTPPTVEDPLPSPAAKQPSPEPPAIQPQAELESVMCPGAAIVFGPSPEKGDLVATIAGAGMSALVGETAEELLRSETILSPGRVLTPCMIMFCHYIPGKQKQPCTEAEAKAWQDKFLNCIVPLTDTADKQLYFSCKVMWTGNVRDSHMTPTFTWPELSTEKCLAFAKAIEQVYEKSRLLSSDAPLTLQVRLTAEKLRTATVDGTFTQADFPAFEPTYLDWVNAQIDWERTKFNGDEHKERLIRETALDMLWTALRKRAICSNTRVADAGMYALFALKPNALQWPDRTGGADADAIDSSCLLEYLRFRDWEVREEAAKRLGRLGPKAEFAVTALTELLKDETVAGKAAAEALGRIGPAAAPAVPALVERMKAKIKTESASIDALGLIGTTASSAVPELAAIVDQGYSSAARALGMMGKDAASALPQLLRKLQQERWWDHIDVAIAVLNIDSRQAPSALPVLIDGLRRVEWDSYDGRARPRAAEAIGVYGANAKGAAKALQGCLNDKNQELRKAAAAALEKLGVPIPTAVDAPEPPPPAAAKTVRKLEPSPQAIAKQADDAGKKWWQFWK